MSLGLCILSSCGPSPEQGSFAQRFKEALDRPFEANQHNVSFKMHERGTPYHLADESQADIGALLSVFLEASASLAYEEIQYGDQRILTHMAQDAKGARSYYFIGNYPKEGPVESYWQIQLGDDYSYLEFTKGKNESPRYYLHDGKPADAFERVNAAIGNAEFKVDSSAITVS